MYHSNNKVTKTNSTERNNKDNNNNNKTTEGKRKQLKTAGKLLTVSIITRCYTKLIDYLQIQYYRPGNKSGS